MPQHEVTSLSFGGGFQRSSTRTERIRDHVGAMAAQGWHLVAVDHTVLELPMTWRFFWVKGAPLGTPEGE